MTELTEAASTHLLNADLRAALAGLPEVPLSYDLVPAFRAAPTQQPFAPPAPEVTEQFIPGPADNPSLRVVVVDPAPGATGRSAMLHIHGGGYVFGTPEHSIRTLQAYAAGAGCLIVSVDYRLAPEAPFPCALEDNLAAYAWLQANAAKFGVDPRCIGIGGESAGGGHAAALAIAIRDRKAPDAGFLFLVSAMLDDRTGSSRPAPPYTGDYVWKAEHNCFGWTALLGQAAGAEHVPYGSVPARVQDLTGLPRSFIASSTLDLFVDENIEFARRLIAAGVPVDLYVQSGCYHGFNMIDPDAPSSKFFNARLLDGLRHCIAPPG